ncbi:AI-2E family transporter [Chelativorans sp. AA-79]|uniref:AI-2E family transporter n=1 Tax=Chelativorans sp. AA-79 TaxID=3028735 RepID=UPI0023F7E180|nr:AI-2E family transporter [Chelativorans sp. AA-79]WEX10638.1 AI-2E family transporter [Chelativorans sp. AA-79]
MSSETGSTPRPHQPSRDRLTLAGYTRRVLIATAIVSLAFLIWHLRHTAAIAFAAVVVAAVLTAASDLTRRFVPLGSRWSLALSSLLIIVVIGAALWFAWPDIQTQSSNLLQQLPQAVRSIETRTGISLPNSLPQLGGSLEGAFNRILSDIAAMLQTAAAALTGVVLVIVAGVFLAVNPGVYRRGFLLLFPTGERGRVEHALGRTGTALKFWLAGQLLSMAIVGALVGLGAWAIGLPSPLALALIAFLTEFVPLIGPFAGAVPGLLLALGEGWTMLLWAALLYLAVQQLESNLITPIVQREAVKVPPALFMLSVVAMGALFGILGVLLAGPLTVAAFVLVRTLYVEDTLGVPLRGPGGSEESATSQAGKSAGGDAGMSSRFAAENPEKTE